MATTNPAPTPRDSSPLWRAPALLRAAGETLRPGGFALTDRACELAGLRPGWPVLDVGCGRGATVLRLRTRYGAQALGVDPDPVLDTTEHSGAAPYMVRGTAQALPFDSGSFRMLTCECVLSLVHDPAQALAEFHRVLQPGGILALSDLYLRQGRSGPDCGCGGDQDAPVSSNPYSCVPFSCADGAMTRRDLEAHLARAGFRLHLFEDHSPLLRSLAAKLVWQGLSPACAPQTAPTGYCLILAVAEHP